MAEELLDLVLSGKTFREIADQFGVVREDSVKGAYKHAKKVIIHQMREQGATWGEIAIRLGLLKEDQVAA